MDRTALKRFFQGLSDEKESQEVSQWLLDPKNDERLKAWLGSDWSQTTYQEPTLSAPSPDMDRIWANMKNDMDRSKEEFGSQENLFDRKKLVVRSYTRLAIAATVIGILFSFIYFNYGSISKDEEGPSLTPIAKEPISDVAPPDESRAVLTLADGSKVYLDSTYAGRVLDKGQGKVTMNEKGEIIYAGNNGDAVTYNTLTIPSGSKPIRLILSDGTKVWLNAASSITYPTAFTAAERRVSMKGELYFEVAKLDRSTFEVQTDALKIKVLGTHFNVNAYESNGISKVTLLEGAVEVQNDDKTRKIIPGQQVYGDRTKLNVNAQADLDEVMAWKNGEFFFTGNDIKDIMREVERFYDVEVEYRDDIAYQFVAKISRDVNLSSFLEKLEMTNLVHFKIDGKKIIVSK